MKKLINGKANAATTLAGYGITDGMTATEIASAISTAIAGTDHLSRVMVDSTADINVAADGAEKKICLIMQNRRAYPLQTLICSWAFYGKNCRDTQQ